MIKLRFFAKLRFDQELKISTPQLQNSVFDFITLTRTDNVKIENFYKILAQRIFLTG